MMDLWTQPPMEDWPCMEDEGRIVDAVVEEKDNFVLITGKLEFLEMMENEEDPTGETDLPLFNIITARGAAYSFHEVVEYRFVEITGRVH